tara:strand:- start:45 stop:329 length:285 start_codon:yes stop_codon:yes gene_type:complete
MRYKNTKIKIDADGNRYYSPTVVSSIPIKDSDIFIKVTEGFRFDMLAQRYYNDSTLWWIIAKANDMSQGQLGLDVTKKLRIPTEIDDILDSFNK